MRIKRAKVFGFGKWIDKEIDFTEHELMIFYGENESGKTSLYQFILFMLFGMPPKERKFYQPKTSGKLGGHLEIEDQEVGSFVIERLDDVNNGKATCLLPNGETYDESWLYERLHGMDKKTFQSIFSFTALDLNAIKEMKGTELGEVLLSIGLTGSSSIYQIEKDLENRLEQLFKPNGKNPEMNKQIQLVHQLANELSDIKNEEATYHEKMTNSVELEKKIATLKNEESILNESLRWTDKQITAYPFLEDFQDTTRKYKDFQEQVTFPTNGIERLEKIKEKIHPLESELAVLKQNERNYEESLSEMKKDRLLKTQVDELKEKRELEKENQSLTEKLKEIMERKKHLAIQLKEELTELQIDFDKEDLVDFSLPFYMEETWKQLRDENERLRQEKSKLEVEKIALVEEEEFLKNKIHTEKKNALSEEKIEQLKLKRKEGEVSEQLEELYHSSREQRENYKKNYQKKEGRSKKYFWIGFILSIVGLLIGRVGEQSIFFILAILLFILSLGQLLFVKWNGQEMEKLLQSPQRDEKQPKVSPNEMKTIEEQLEVEEERKTRVRNLQSDLNRQQINVLQWEEKMRSVKEQERRFHDQREEQYMLYPFLRTIEITYWPEYYQRLKTLLERYEEEKELTVKENEVALEIQNIEREVSSFIQEWSSETSEDIDVSFRWMDELLDAEKNLKERMSHLTELLKENKEKQRVIAEQVNVHEKEKRQLFQIAQVETEEAFYELASYRNEKEKIEERLEKNERQLNSIFGEEEWESLFPLKVTEPELKKEREEIEARQAKIQEEIEQQRSLLAEVNATLKQMEGSEIYSQKMHQLEIEKEKLNDLAKEWSILKIEKDVLAKTKYRYQEKYLGEVMDETTTFFQSITNGNYQAVHPPEEKQSFQVVSRDGLRYNVEELSQGTMNQLYVSLRLAISQVMTRKREVPFLVDDAFVHFDDVRIERMMEILANISRTQQVIMFTCKSDVVEASRRLEIPVVTI